MYVYVCTTCMHVLYGEIKWYVRMCILYACMYICIYRANVHALCCVIRPLPAELPR